MKRNTYLLLFLLMLIFASFFVSCSDDPNILGYELVKDQDINVKHLTLAQDTSALKAYTSKQVAALGAAKYFLVGYYGNDTAVGLVKFVPTISDWNDYIKSDSLIIRSARIILHQTYQLGDSSAYFGFNAYEIQNNWSENTVTVDTTITTNSIPLTIGTTQVDSNALSFWIDTALAKKWFLAAVDSARPANYGIMLKPKAGTGRIIGFEGVSSSSTVHPFLEVTMRKRWSNSDTTITFNANSDAHFVKGTIPVTPTDAFFVQSGLTLRGVIWMDISQLPPNIIINHAELTLKKHDAVNSSHIGSPYASAMTVYHVSDSAALTVSSSLYASMALSNDTYTGDLTTIIGQFYHDKKNIMLLVTASEDLNGDNLTAFFNHYVNSNPKKPLLEITYTEKGGSK